MPQGLGGTVMIRGWYTGASGMNAQQNRLDAISNNLANVDTAGYKRDVTVRLLEKIGRAHV